MNKNLVVKFNKSASNFIKKSNTSNKNVNYGNLFKICQLFLSKASNNGTGVCNCTQHKFRNPKGVDHVMHTCGKGFFDQLNNSGWTQMGPGWGGEINGKGFFDQLNNSGWTQMGPGWGGGMKRKGGYVSEIKEKKLKAMGFGGAWGTASQTHTLSDLGNWVKEGYDTIKEVTDNI